jgi:hypothetical protein
MLLFLPFSSGIATLVCGRSINGICVDIISSQVPVYLAEIVNNNVRGSSLSTADSYGQEIFTRCSVGFSCLCCEINMSKLARNTTRTQEI